MKGDIDKLKDDIETAVSDGPVDWGELANRLEINNNEKFEDALLELLAEHRVRHDPREGTYRTDDE